MFPRRGRAWERFDGRGPPATTPTGEHSRNVSPSGPWAATPDGETFSSHVVSMKCFPVELATVAKRHPDGEHFQGSHTKCFPDGVTVPERNTQKVRNVPPSGPRSARGATGSTWKHFPARNMFPRRVRRRHLDDSCVVSTNPVLSPRRGNISCAVTPTGKQFSRCHSNGGTFGRRKVWMSSTGKHS